MGVSSGVGVIRHETGASWGLHVRTEAGESNWERVDENLGKRSFRTADLGCPKNRWLMAALQSIPSNALDGAANKGGRRRASHILA